MSDPLISICIPAYERIDFLTRLIESIKVQNFRNFEVIITDDSKSDQVAMFVKNNPVDFPLFYHKNIPSLGTSKNMVEGFRYSRAQWIKVIHDDDFFTSPDALGYYAEATKQNARFVFSGYNEYFESTGRIANKTITQKQFTNLEQNPSMLFARNKIGPPSVSMIHISVKEVYDTKLNWFTDMEYYFRILQMEKALYIAHPLVNVSTNDTQITNFTKTNAAVVIPESLYLINKYGYKVTSDILAYDSWWRLYRNMNVRSVDDIRKYSDADIPAVVKKMVSHIKNVPEKVLKIGVFSKISMALSFAANKEARKM